MTTIESHPVRVTRRVRRDPDRSVRDVKTLPAGRDRRREAPVAPRSDVFAALQSSAGKLSRAVRMRRTRPYKPPVILRLAGAAGKAAIRVFERADRIFD